MFHTLKPRISIVEEVKLLTSSTYRHFFSLRCVGVILLLCASMLALMKPAVQTLSLVSQKGPQPLLMLGVTSPVGTHTFVSTPPTIWHRKGPVCSTLLSHRHTRAPAIHYFYRSPHLLYFAAFIVLLAATSPSAHASTLIFSLQLYS